MLRLIVLYIRPGLSSDVVRRWTGNYRPLSSDVVRRWAGNYRPTKGRYKNKKREPARGSDEYQTVEPSGRRIPVNGCASDVRSFWNLIVILVLQ